MLTVQRQYSLPNCVLILEGFNTDATSSPRPLLSTLSRFECHFSNESQTIQGDRALLDLLARSVHNQAQSILSGVQSKDSTEESQDLTLANLGSGTYRLTIAEPLLLPPSSQSDAGDSPQPPKADRLELQLNAVQLFDLVEAFDQLMDDQQTLPDLSLTLRPLSRKEARSQEAIAQKFLPFGLGVASLALAAAISFVIPVPEIRKPAAPEQDPASEEVLEPEEGIDAESQPGQEAPIDGPSPDESTEGERDSEAQE